MKKSGFTLAEMLIALGIIGIIGAIMIPSIGNSRSNTSKIMFLKAYDSLVEATSILTRNTNVFSNIYISGNNVYNIERFPLLDAQTPQDADYTNFYCDSPNQAGPCTTKSAKKFFYALKDSLNGTTVGVCNNNSNSCSFRVPVGGLIWEVANTGQNAIANPGANIDYYNLVTIYTKGNNNAIIDAGNNNQIPNAFSLYVTADGDVVPAGQYAQYYIRTRTATRKGKKPTQAELNNYTAINVNNLAQVAKSTINIGSDISVTVNQNNSIIDDNTTPDSEAVNNNNTNLDTTFHGETFMP